MEPDLNWPICLVAWCVNTQTGKLYLILLRFTLPEIGLGNTTMGNLFNTVLRKYLQGGQIEKCEIQHGWKRRLEKPRRRWDNILKFVLK